MPRSRIGPTGGAEIDLNIIPLCGVFENGCHEAYDHHRMAIRDILRPDEIAYMILLVGEGETDRRIDARRDAA